ncbi:acyl-CoA dehydrogenase family protein [Actinomycetospora termitidis]|uniref:Acyl-CoA dehydrogenase family protein n=1 Tax=Actinomycetospora termitidis TaxID=3053470 RepID=A0ABT7MFJ9_9PSEU|nr:acyl-CoA dehydrogenase family protein [Actinomycetospora sp. Odt1-22]MDL5158657.1 acyl-CoA dehydrogenase family protein [Actinomycetospora sp. Odt1-22]
MDFELTDPQRRVRDTAREVATSTLLPGYAERARAGRVEPALRRELGGLGLIAPELPVEVGGRGTDRVTTGLVCEELARGDLNVVYLQVVGSLVGQILVGCAPELAAEWVPRITSGDQVVGIGLTEPHGGSDAGVPRMTAARDGAGWRLHGTKSLSFAADAAAVVVFARTEEAGRGRGISAFLVPLDAEGVTREAFPDIGTAAVGRGAVHFDGVHVPAENLIGAEGSAFSQVMQGFDFSRALIGLQCLGAAEQSVDETWAYVSEREAFDRPLSSQQGVAFPLAEAETLLAAARLQCLETLWRKDTGRPHTAQAAMCKWWAPKTAHDAITTCLLLHGQYGYRAEKPFDQRMRDVLGLQIGDGTAQIMKLVIARQRVGRALAP